MWWPTTYKIIWMVGDGPPHRSICISGRRETGQLMTLSATYASLPSGRSRRVRGTPTAPVHCVLPLPLHACPETKLSTAMRSYRLSSQSRDTGGSSHPIMAVACKKETEADGNQPSVYHTTVSHAHWSLATVSVDGRRKLQRNSDVHCAAAGDCDQSCPLWKRSRDNAAAGCICHRWCSAVSTLPWHSDFLLNSCIISAEIWRVQQLHCSFNTLIFRRIRYIK